MKKKLLILFFSLFAVKILLTLLIHGPNLFPDESCALLMARYFIHTFSLPTCGDLTALPAAGTMPLQPILLSPIYLFFNFKAAFHAALIVNTFIASTLIFPLFSIFKRYIKSTTAIIISIIFLLFIPEVIAYEHLVKSEIVFLALNIWFLSTYISALEDKKSKTIPIILAILAAFARPFGFITLFAFATNEFILSKNKKKPLLLLGIGLLFTTIIMLTFLPGIFQTLWIRLQSIFNIKNTEFIVVSLKNQINSFTVATYLVPLLIFANNIKRLGKTKGFLISFILINFIISFEHTYGYYLDGQGMALLTRYINSSLFYIFLFATIFIQTEPKKSLKVRPLWILLFLIPLAFFTYSPLKIALNTSLPQYFDTTTNYMLAGVFLSKFFVLTVLIFLILFILKKRTTIIAAIAITMIISTTSLIYTVHQDSLEEYNHPDWQLFGNSHYKILFVLQGTISPRTYQKILTFTPNQITLTDNSSLNEEDIKKYDYIITNLPAPLELVGETYHFEKIYKTR